MKRFPVIAYETNKHGIRTAAIPLTIPWAIAKKAYHIYSSKYGKEQPLEQIAERGGFSINELDVYFPNWKKEISFMEEYKRWIQGKLNKERDNDIELDRHGLSEKSKISRVIIEVYEEMLSKIESLEKE